MALRYNKGMIMIRKKGKLPGKTAKISYKIEYGKDVQLKYKIILLKKESVF